MSQFCNYYVLLTLAPTCILFSSLSLQATRGPPRNGTTTTTVHTTGTSASDSVYSAEYRTSVLTLVCCVVATLLEIHYNSHSSGCGSGSGRTVRGACAAGMLFILLGLFAITVELHSLVKSLFGENSL